MTGKVIDLAAAAVERLGVSPGAAHQRVPDLQNPYRASKKGNVVCALEWAPTEAGLEPAIFLMAYPRVLGGRGFVIPLSRVPLYVNEDGTSKPRLAEVARKAALRLGLDDTTPTISRICDVVMFNVPELREMPKAPPAPH